MDISLKNEKLQGIISELIDLAYCPGETTEQLPDDGRSAIGGYFSPGSAASMFLGTEEDWDTEYMSIGPKIRNQIIGRLLMECRAALVKRGLSAPSFGDLQPDYASYPTPEEAIDQAEAATRLVHEVLCKEGEFADHYDNFCGHIGIYSHTMQTLCFKREYEMRPMTFNGLDDAQLADMMERGFEIESMREYLADATPGAEVVHYDVSGQMKRDVSKVDISLARYEDILIDKHACSKKDLTTEGLATWMTRQQALDRYSYREDGIVEKINEYYGELAEGVQDKPMLIYDAVFRIQEKEESYLVHAVVLGESKTFLIMEQLDDSPHVLDLFVNLPNSMNAVSFAERLANHQLVLTDLIRNLSESAFESSQTAVYTTGSNVTALTQGTAKDQKVGTVIDPDKVILNQSNFAGDVMQFVEYMTRDGERLAGASGELDLPSLSSATVYAAEIVDESRNLMREYLTTMVAQSMRQVFEKTYRILVNNIEHRSIYSPEQGRVIPYDLTQWPRELVFVPSIGFGRGSKSTNLLNKKEALMQLLELSASPMGGAIVSPENLYTAAQDYLTELGADATRLLTKYVPQPPQPTETEQVLAHQKEQLAIQTELTTRDQDFNEAMQTAELELKADDQKHEQQMDVAELSLKMGDRDNGRPNTTRTAD